MIQVTDSEVDSRLRLDNPWWEAGGGIDDEFRALPRRAYLQPFLRLVRDAEVRRAIVMLGPRRVGKTILLFHTIQSLIDEGVAGRDILYVSLETPMYTGRALENLVRRFESLFDRPQRGRQYVLFDEIQYLRDWEVHLKSLVDTFRHVRFVSTGSAAAALRAKSVESGAGRFTEFRLPPLTFFEYLRFVQREDELIRTRESDTGSPFMARDIHGLNDEFVRYLNHGGFPEAVFSERIQANPRRYIKSDIIDKVLLRDLPILYGITDIQELNSLFNTLAYNSGNELSLEDLSRTSHVAKNTLTRYLEYLEAAFLIRRLKRVDQDARRFQRATTFKVFLTNPAMRAALFGPIDARSESVGRLAETAVFSQWMHNTSFVDSLHYARWKTGEVDLVSLDPGRQKPRFAVEVKWSDRACDDSREIKGILEFARQHRLGRRPLVTTLTRDEIKTVNDTEVEFSPCSLHCYTVGKNTLERTRR